ncbi:MAG: D-alanyl-D-alanine carboxypeptidase [Clostridium sp.]|uniref:D-alanyl-D-alanine carboxypeptidase family protein n=1 Tax=Clostridium sp. TaxID=1506 RepID=UPI0025BB7A96|nr:D-alanyl-D-alanine carboxypeptidase family protein [Clostridium sp.]MCH3964131.1 D-alanyl-D-alanine carboxypeptidase [Clostridium sp.]MCI1715312.1 D-alanyl-D-alanine carboxypeptidase [Clostridium sp.]MCI1799897.1 D-alanyl-D-alanine carboxypeptidase [Clostridium sp.]MCI1813495.1 D-alanyl-D-alanine carboxypeptidase [Clostridium sp.]MCI1870715.1 D-alanyl-D-alanine carboxypeptidase [Clostridium sp.]
MKNSYKTFASRLLSAFLVFGICVVYSYDVGAYESAASRTLSTYKAEVPDNENSKSENTGDISVDAKSALLMEPVSGKVIYEKNSHEKLEPASVTKIMTMLLTMEAVDSGKISLNDKVTVSENAKKMGGSSMLLDTGEVRTVEELIKGIGIASGNDAAVAMAEYLGGNEQAFVGMMNKRAQELGMKDTTFKNCTGLTAPGHLTSAYDISIMSRELLKHPKILKYTGTYMETISEGRKSPIELVNHNKLVRFFKGCDGLKTGFTDAAKYCISATSSRDNVRMLAVIMGSPTYKIRNKDASMLMNYGFSKYKSINVINKDKPIKKINLNKKGNRFFYAVAKDNLNAVMEKTSNDKVTYDCVLNKNKRKYKKGDDIGYCSVYVNGKSIGKVGLYCDRDVKLPGIIENLKNGLSEIINKGV